MNPNTTRTLSPVWLLSILTGLNLFNYLDRYIMSAVLTPLQQDFGITDGALGRVSSRRVGALVCVVWLIADCPD